MILLEAGVRVIGNVIDAALRSPDLDTITAEELRDFTHANRRKLLALATSGFSDFLKVDDSLFYFVRHVDDPPIELVRDGDGSLSLKNDWQLPPREGFDDMISAAALSCPALRLQHPNRALLTVQEKAALGSSNYVDHVLAALINAAYARGMFSVRRSEEAKLAS